MRQIVIRVLLLYERYSHLCDDGKNLYIIHPC